MSQDLAGTLILSAIIPCLILFLNRIFGGGDKTRDQIDQLRADFFTLALHQKDVEKGIRAHSDVQYATKTEIIRLDRSIADLASAMRANTDQLTVVLNSLVVRP